MKDYLKNLEGITSEEWYKIKTIVENKFFEEEKKNIFKCDENVLQNLNAIM